MADEQGRSRLGRGLAALMGDVGEETKKAAEPTIAKTLLITIHLSRPLRPVQSIRIGA